MARTSLAAERVAHLADECLCDSRLGLLRAARRWRKKTSRSLDVESANPMRMMKGVNELLFQTLRLLTSWIVTIVRADWENDASGGGCR